MKFIKIMIYNISLFKSKRRHSQLLYRPRVVLLRVGDIHVYLCIVGLGDFCTKLLLTAMPKLVNCCAKNCCYS